MRQSMRCLHDRKPVPANALVKCDICDEAQPLVVIEDENAWRDVLDEFIDEHYEEHGVLLFSSYV